MLLKMRTIALIAGLIVLLASPGITFAHGIAKRHVAVGTVSSIDNNQVVINEKSKGKERPMTFMLEPSTKQLGNVATGSKVAIHYKKQNHQKVATSIRERGAKSAHAGKSVKTTS
jgi:ferredoxin-fold anticodon binding domain-containing protein